MKAQATALSGLLLLTLFWYGYTYSLTLEVFALQGWVGAAIPTVLGLCLFAMGWVVGRSR